MGNLRFNETNNLLEYQSNRIKIEAEANEGVNFNIFQPDWTFVYVCQTPLPVDWRLSKREKQIPLFHYGTGADQFTYIPYGS